MAFFGLPERDFPTNELNEDVPVYTWGEESYDGLGDALQEGGDDLNDETFGVGPVGKDFEFASSGVPDPPRHQQPQPATTSAPQVRDQPLQRLEQRTEQNLAPGRSAQNSGRSAQPSISSIWDDQSAFSVLPRLNGSSRAGDHPRASPAPVQQHGQAGRLGSFGLGNQSAQSHQRPRTLQEIEAEMQLNAERQRQEVLDRERDRERERERQYELLLEQQRQREIYDQRQQDLLLERQREQLLQQRQQQELIMRQDQLLREQLREQQMEQVRQQQQEIRQQQFRQEQIQQLLLQQQREEAQQRTPPPRMMPTSQSPRFLEHQRQVLLLQQQQELQQQQRVQELQEQLRIEELERRMAASNLNPRRDPAYGGGGARRTPNYSAAELQAAQLLQQQRQQQQQQQQLQLQLQIQQQQLQQQQLQQQQIQQQQQYRRQSSRSPAISSSPHHPGYPHDGSFQQNQNLQLQQRLLADLTQNDFGRDLGVSQADQEAVRLEAMRKIVEAEKMEEKRRRKASKIAHMSRYNDLMTQSDKDFITRIQVSQLVTQDPYADDFYAQVYGAILRSRMGIQSQDERVLKFGSGGGIGLGLANKGASRRPSAMQRMEQQVERIVSNARKREEEKGLHALHSLQGALGKTSGRSYKAAPRQLLQVDSSAASNSPTLSHAAAHISKTSAHHAGAAEEAAKLGREALGEAASTDGLIKTDPLTRRESLVILEELYDLVLRIEQMRRDQPTNEDVEAAEQWKQDYEGSVDELWDKFHVMAPVETSDPHPFISLLMPIKGKRILPRVTRHLDNQRMLTLLTLLVACFGQLDVVKQAPILDSVQETHERADVERQTQAFLSSVMQSILPIVSVSSLRLVAGLLGLLLDKSNIVAVAQSRPGLAILTLFLSRVEVIKQTLATTPEGAEMPTMEESQQWRNMFDHLFRCLAPFLVLIFPSSRITLPQEGAAGTNNSSIQTDALDQPVWQFLAALALHAGPEQHQILVSTLRDKILDNVLSVNKGWVHDEEERQAKLANVNLFLHALNLDSSQIAM